MSAFGAEDAHEEEESLADELADVKMSADEVAVAAGAGAGEAEGAPDSARSAGAAIRVEDAVKLEYCPNCSMPPEYCEFNMPEVFGKCLPWILANCREALSKATLAKVTGEELKEEEDEGESAKSSKRAGVAGKKKASAMTTKVIISRIQRQKKKYVTTVLGLETVPDLKIKDAAKAFGKKFSSGASISETATGEKEVTIQGDCSHDLPAYLIKEFKVASSCIFMSDEAGKLRPLDS